MKRGTVLLADRHSPMLEGIRVLLEETFEAVVMVADAVSMYIAIDRLEPECVVVDISLPQPGQATENVILLLHRRHPTLALVVLSVHDERAVAERVLELGAMGFVVKGTAVSDLLPAIDAVLRGEKYVSPCVHP